MELFVSSLSSEATFPESFWGLGISMHELYPDSDVYDICFRRAERALTESGSEAMHRFRSDYCRALQQRGHLDRALEQGLASLDLDSEYVEAMKCLGQIHLAKADMQKARLYADKVRNAQKE